MGGRKAEVGRGKGVEGKERNKRIWGEGGGERRRSQADMLTSLLQLFKHDKLQE